MEKEELYKKMLKKYGSMQEIIAIEELSELQKEFSKSLRGKFDENNMTEEMADVEIMMEQMKLYHHIDPIKLEVVKQAKLKRTEQRYLANGKN